MKKMCFARLSVILFSVAVISAMPIHAQDEIEIDSDIVAFSVEGQLKVGILSDTQFNISTNGQGKYEDNFRKSLRVMKANEVNMLLFPGDIVDKVSESSLQAYVDIINEIYGEDKPIIQTIMGNHDYWTNANVTGLRTTKAFREIFERIVGVSPWTHYKVNGFHFIGVSPNNGSMNNAYGLVTSWMKSRLEIAYKDTPDQPIFVLTHNSPKDTVYGSDDWGDTSFGHVLEAYENVVNISGHLHYSLMDERSIYQKDFTAFSTQSISYTELEVGKENGSVPPGAHDCYMGLIMAFHDERIDIKRLRLAHGKLGTEEKADKRWTLPIPLTKDKFTYTDARRDVNTAPSMSEQTPRTFNEGNKTFIEFGAGSDNDFVHSYKLVWSDGVEQLYFSDFYKGMSFMKPVVKQQILNKAAGTYDVKVYAIDSYGIQSSSYVEIKGVVVK